MSILPAAYQILDHLKLHQMGTIPRYCFEYPILNGVQETIVKPLSKKVTEEVLKNLVASSEGSREWALKKEFIRKGVFWGSTDLNQRIRRAVKIVHNEFTQKDSRLFIQEFAQSKIDAEIAVHRVLHGVFRTPAEATHLQLLIERVVKRFILDKAAVDSEESGGFARVVTARFQQPSHHYTSCNSAHFEVMELVERIQNAFKAQMATQPAKFSAMLKKNPELRSGFLTNTKGVLGKKRVPNDRRLYLVAARSILSYLESANIIRHDCHHQKPAPMENSADFVELLKTFDEMKEGPVLVTELHRTFRFNFESFNDIIPHKALYSRDFDIQLFSPMVKNVTPEQIEKWICEGYKELAYSTPKKRQVLLPVLDFLLKIQTIKPSAPSNSAKECNSHKRKREQTAESPLLISLPLRKKIQAAAERGCAHAQVDLGWIYEQSQNHKEAAKCYRKAADQGNATAAYRLSLLYKEGRGVNHDDDQVVVFAIKAQQLGHAFALPLLNEMYKNGKGLKTLFPWYENEAKNGNGVAAYRLFVRFHHPRHRDTREAVLWLKQAKKLGSPEINQLLRAFEELGITCENLYKGKYATSSLYHIRRCARALAGARSAKRAMRARIRQEQPIAINGVPCKR